MAAYAEAGLEDFVPEFLVAIGLQDGTVEQLAALEDPCEGTSASVQRRLEFTVDGFAGFDSSGEQVDGSPIQLIGADSVKLMVDPGDPEVTLRYTVDDDAISFEVVLPKPCDDQECRSQRAWAIETFGLGPWRRDSG